MWYSINDGLAVTLMIREETMLLQQEHWLWKEATG